MQCSGWPGNGKTGVLATAQARRAKAAEQVTALQKICLIPCEEYEDLKKKIAEYRGKAGK